MKVVKIICCVVGICLTMPNSLFSQASDGVCTPATTVDPVMDVGQTTVCSDGSNALTFPAPSGSLPDATYVIEVNGVITDFNLDGAIDATSLAVDDQVCVTAFTYDLAAINVILNDASGTCSIPFVNCDDIFGIPGLEAGIADVLSGANDGTPGLNSLQEALEFASFFGAPITSVASAVSTLDATNAQIGGFLDNICYASTAPVCYTIEDCTIPTIGQWGLIILSLLMSTLALVSIRQEDGKQAFS